MKRVLVISPHFPPVNAPDMQRIRMNLPFFRKFNWEPVIISVDEKYVNGYIDENLLDTIPENIEIHKTKAIHNVLTGFMGIGSVAIKSFYHIYKKGCELLKSGKFDLVFFTTSNFHVCTLGPIWKRKFNIPFVIDLQDPWYNKGLNGNSNSILNKHRISQFTHKNLEAYTIPKSDGLISVSDAYIKDVQAKYNGYSKPAEVINFGSSIQDFNVVSKKGIKPFPLEKEKINVVYPGALTNGFLPVIKAFFRSFKENNQYGKNYKFYFIGTSYFRKEKGLLTEFIEQEGLSDLIIEYPQRMEYFETLATMKSADILFLPGSVDGDYNPSKICNAIMSGTPVFSVFNSRSIVHELILRSDSGYSVAFEDNDGEDEIYSKINSSIDKFFHLHESPKPLKDINAIDDYSAEKLTGKLCRFFDKVIA